MKLGFYSPLPPQPTGVADYSAAMLHELQKLGDVRVDAPGELNLYHLGNNPLHGPIYEKLLQHAGVVVLHDAVLHHFLLGRLSREEYIREFRYGYKTAAPGLPERLWEQRSQSGADVRYFQYPMLTRACEHAKAVIVHNAAAAATVRRECPGVPVIELPHLLATPHPTDSGDIYRRREALGAGPKTLLAAIFGHLREAKRVMSCLRVLARLKDIDVVLLLAGSMESKDLRRAVDLADHDGRVRRIPYTPEHEFWELVHSVDVCVNLRYPSAGETSGIGLRLMAAGKPVIYTDGPEVSAFPEGTCVRIESGTREEAMLEAVLRWFAMAPQDARQIGGDARKHVAAMHDPSVVCRKLWQTLEGLAN